MTGTFPPRSLGRLGPAVALGWADQHGTRMSPGRSEFLPDGRSLTCVRRWMYHDMTAASLVCVRGRLAAAPESSSGSQARDEDLGVGDRGDIGADLVIPLRAAGSRWGGGRGPDGRVGISLDGPDLRVAALPRPVVYPCETESVQ